MRVRGRIGHIYVVRRRIGHIYRLGGGLGSKDKDRGKESK